MLSCRVFFDHVGLSEPRGGRQAECGRCQAGLRRQTESGGCLAVQALQDSTADRVSGALRVVRPRPVHPRKPWRTAEATIKHH